MGIPSKIYPRTNQQTIKVISVPLRRLIEDPSNLEPSRVGKRDTHLSIPPTKLLLYRLRSPSFGLSLRLPLHILLSSLLERSLLGIRVAWLSVSLLVRRLFRKDRALSQARRGEGGCSRRRGRDGESVDGVGFRSGSWRTVGFGFVGCCWRGYGNGGGEGCFGWMGLGLRRLEGGWERERMGSFREGET